MSDQSVVPITKDSRKSLFDIPKPYQDLFVTGQIVDCGELGELTTKTYIDAMHFHGERVSDIAAFLINSEDYRIDPGRAVSMVEPSAYSFGRPVILDENAPKGRIYTLSKIGLDLYRHEMKRGLPL